MHEVRAALRALARSPGSTAIAIATLSLGIGATTAIFSLIHAVVLRPLPYPDADRLVVVHNTKDGESLGAHSSSWLDFEDFRAEELGFQSTALFTYWTYNLTDRDVPLRLTAGRVTGGFFPTLSVAPLMGRVITPSDDAPNAPEVVVLSYGLWQRLFGGEESALGRTLTLNGRPHTVIGVMPPEFRFPEEDVELWSAVSDSMRGMQRHNRFMLVVARLRESRSFAQAQESMSLVSARLENAYTESNRGFRAQLRTAHETLVSDFRPALTFLMAAVGFVLLIACTSVSHILVARAVVRRREAATRVALGASFSRLSRQYVFEGLVIAIAGGAIGFALAIGATRMLVSLHPGGVPRLDEVGASPPVLVFSVVVALVTGLGLGLVAGLDGWRSARAGGLGAGQRELRGARNNPTGNVLVTAQVAMALVLLAGSGLLFHSFWKLTRIEPGFRPDRTLTLSVFLTAPRYRALDDSVAYVERAIEALAPLPGVRTAAAVTDPPLGDGFLTMSMFEDGRPLSIAEAPEVTFRGVSPDYFRALSISLLAGRTFDRTDTADTQKVVVVNESFVRRVFSGGEALGRHIRWADAERDQTPLRVVGVVRDVHHRGLDRDEGPVVYAPIAQITFYWLRWFTFVIEAKGDPEVLAGPSRDALLEVDRDQPVFQIRTLATALSGSLAGRRFQLFLVELFALVAILMAALGIYSVIAHSVTHRTREVGLRLTLGARRRDILSLFVRQGMRWTCYGIAVGLSGSLILAHLMRSLLFGIEPADATTFAIVPGLLVAVALLAIVVPARRAAAVDPASAIRQD